uniref:Uncharacterized protein n=1 Tax=Leersia perrieri TaxID=77586 RepID=A0A0D9VC40_9ORYZ
MGEEGKEVCSPAQPRGGGGRGVERDENETREKSRIRPPPPELVGATLPYLFLRRRKVAAYQLVGAASPTPITAAAKECSRSRDYYTLRNIDMWRFFLPRPSAAAAAGAHSAVEYGSLPPHAMSFYSPTDRMGLMLLGGKHNMVLAADQTGGGVLYDPAEHAVRTIPDLPPCLNNSPDYLTAGDGDLYLFSTSRDGGCFHGLIYDNYVDDWFPSALPPPPIEPVSYAAVGDTEIWASGSGKTYRFDTARREWSSSGGGFTLPFLGLAEYVPKHGLWFGLSLAMDGKALVLSATDLHHAGDGEPRPLRRTLLPLEYTPPDALNCVGVDLVNLGSGRFCIARFFETDDYEELFVVFTAVEVDADAGGLRMLKHRSEMYKLCSETPYWVL